MIGAKHSTEGANNRSGRLEVGGQKFLVSYFLSPTSVMVGERFVCSEAYAVRRSGAYRSENVGTSNHNSGEIPLHRKPKVSLAMIIIQG